MTIPRGGGAGHGSTEYFEESEGAVALNDIVYMASARDQWGNYFDDPEAFYIVDEFSITCTGEGTIQFFAVDDTGTARETLSPAMMIEDLKVPLTASCRWKTEPLRDIAYTVVGDCDVQVRLQVRLFRGSFAQPVHLDLGEE